jgi:ATP-dependent DNA helicase RecG
MTQLDIPLDNLPKTSTVTIKKIKNLGYTTYFELLNHFPSRYETFHEVDTLQNSKEGEKVIIRGVIRDFKNTYTRNRLTIQKITVICGTEAIEVVWYNQPFLSRVLVKGLSLSVAGQVKVFLNKKTLQPEEYETTKPVPIATRQFVPVYPTITGLSVKTLREKIYTVVSSILENSIDEILPSEIITEFNLLPITKSYQDIHFPLDQKSLDKAHHRLSFNELFTIQLSSEIIKREWHKEKTGYLFNSQKYKKNIYDFINALPFDLTASQKKAIEEIITDMSTPNPMNRFLQGDVGSGKTVVAAVAAYFSVLNGFQTIYMAPTAILATQHYQTFLSLFSGTSIKIGLQTAHNKDIKKPTDNDFDIIIGTHALLNLNFDRVGLVIVDEQHRFGVQQRAKLKEKGNDPHLLTMTATPIPRTISLTLYGELEMSLLTSMPSGRLPVKTYLVPQHKRTDSYEWIRNHIKEKAQVFVICPLIEESENETMQTVKAAEFEFKHLQEIFPEFHIGLLHGKMKSQEKDEVMKAFKEHDLDILVSTSVVEVGIDIPNASIIVIEGAERFGLAQLHQLRGRVGRRDIQSYCLLFTSENTENTDRLHFFSNHTSGIELAEYDMKLRGPGSIFGTRQHGFKEFKIADIGNYEAVMESKKAVLKFLASYSLSDYQTLKKEVEKYMTEKISRD